MTAPAYCPQCLTENVIATVNGPTCRHQPESGAAWFPEWWASADLARRVAWLEGKK